jgi:flagellar L-ring protein precursor FlgH
MFVTASRGRAESIWERRSQRSAFLFRDNRARRVGDLLTVRIQESTFIDNDEERTLGKDTSLSFLFDLAGAFRQGSINMGANSTTTSNRQFDGESQLESDRRFIDDITVTVVDILPNGNLVIEGSRRRMVTNECRMLRLSGVVRPDDIGLGNIVDSRHIANFQISYEGGGDESSFVNQGGGGRLMNWIWPF